MATTAASKKQKGSRLEHHIADRINDVLGEYGIKAKRMLLSGAVDGFEGDVWTNCLPIKIEAKNCERHNIWEEWEQALNQAGKDMPILVISRNRCKTPLAVLTLEDLIFFFELAIQKGWVTKRK